MLQGSRKRSRTPTLFFPFNKKEQLGLYLPCSLYMPFATPNVFVLLTYISGKNQKLVRCSTPLYTHIMKNKLKKHTQRHKATASINKRVASGHYHHQLYSSSFIHTHPHSSLLSFLTLKSHQSIHLLLLLASSNMSSLLLLLALSLTLLVSTPLTST